MKPIEVISNETTCYLIKISGKMAYVVNTNNNRIDICELKDLTVTDRWLKKTINTVINS